MEEIQKTERVTTLFRKATELCQEYRHEFVMPEHLLKAFIDDSYYAHILDEYYPSERLNADLKEHLLETEQVPTDRSYMVEPSEQMNQLIEIACQHVVNSSAKALDIPHLLDGLLSLNDSWACYLLKNAIKDDETLFLSHIITAVDWLDTVDDSFGDDDEDDGESDYPFSDAPPKMDAWKKLVTCMNDCYEQQNPLIGREAELQRTIQVLCRRDKNNPLHVGEPGVGKTSLVWGLVRMIEEGKVPERLAGCKVYQLDMGTLLAGTQYRGDFENRIKMIMEGATAEKNETGASVPTIIYIDEIHTMVGAGATSDSSMDVSNMLKPYLEAGNIRFIGSTTYEEYNRHFSRSKGLIRRFQQIDITEPTIEETKNILHQLQPRYEEFHHVRYDDAAIDFAVEVSAKFVNDRFLPDKAIDLIDEAGAAKEVVSQSSTMAVTKADIADVLAKTCKVDALAVAVDEDYERLETLASRMQAQIYGQDEAIRQVVESVQMSRAGLLDDNKPLASLLFVGPTGVGKTEVARVLAQELGIELIRFDMSEYTEKHTVAKLIGSPAGYVGYEDGGLLTDAIRKTPNCVLLLDEIEKAHQDIYNILLQVMDYARLTDNKGHKADFRNVVLIMTSNAGAQYASQSVGFNHTVSRGEAMMKQVKKTFKPEFLNRLSGAVVFHDMDNSMATLILQKKLRQLEEKLLAKQVIMTLTPEAVDHLLKEGFTAEYGAREMDRVIAQQLKPLLMREILFGRLKHGGSVTVSVENAHLAIVGCESSAIS